MYEPMKTGWNTILSGAVGGAVVGLAMLVSGQVVPSGQAASPQAAMQVNMPMARTALANVGVDFREAARKATPSVVHISASGGKQAEEASPFHFFFDGDSPFGGGGGGEASGSGVIYTTDGYIITNNHVVDGAGKLTVTLNDNRKFEATVIGQDPKTDMAVIKIDATGLPVLEAANSDAAEIGEWVLAVGNPLDLTSTVTAGIISAKGRSLELIPGRDAIESFLQTDAAVNPGNSGGALVDVNGRLLGINTAIATRTGMFQGYSFAIPVNLVVRIVDDIIKTGSYQRAFLGVSIYPLDAEAAEELGVSISQGVVVDEVVAGGSAEKAGVKNLDIIVRINDRAIRTVPELTETVGRSKVGDKLTLTVVRDGKEVVVPVRMLAQE
jgi:Do/DeqQ family serine protease